MTWNLNDKELAAVSILEGSKRYGYLIKRVVDQEVIWSLWQSDGWALASDTSTGCELVPIWPHQKFASVCAAGLWSDYESKSIELGEWMDRWIPGMERDRRMVAVFPTPNDRGVVVAPSRFVADLRAELGKYE